MKTWDVIIVGGGIIGLSLAIELRKRNASVLIVERGEPGQEASHAAAGMLADSEFEASSPLKALATASAHTYLEFVHELQDESGLNCDLRGQGTLWLSSTRDFFERRDLKPLSSAEIAECDPDIDSLGNRGVYLEERSVDPRALTAAALQAAKHRDVDISSGSRVIAIPVSQGRAAGARTEKTMYLAASVVNCAGAWSGQISSQHFPVRPVKGQMLCVIGNKLPRHVIRSPDVYLVPRSDGRMVIGSTLEEAGFDKRTDPDAIRKLHRSAMCLLPSLKEARILEAWAGLRPGTPDDLPILGEASIAGYFVATGHFRDGILLAPITARLMAQVITGQKTDLDISVFSASRFAEPELIAS